MAPTAGTRTGQRATASATATTCRRIFRSQESREAASHPRSDPREYWGHRGPLFQALRHSGMDIGAVPVFAGQLSKLIKLRAQTCERPDIERRPKPDPRSIRCGDAGCANAPANPLEYPDTPHSARWLSVGQPAFQAGKWSGRRDSNSRPPVPKTGALPGCATPRLRST